MPGNTKISEHSRVAPRTLAALMAPDRPPPLALDGATTLLDALRAMTAHTVSAILVNGDERPVGILTDRDGMRWLGQGATLDTPLAGLVVAFPGIAAPTMPVAECRRLMERLQVDCLPVVADGRAVGIVWLDELLRETIRHYERIFYEADLDWRFMHVTHTYSC